MQYIRRGFQSSVPDRTEKSPCHNVYLNLDEGAQSRPGINIAKKVLEEGEGEVVSGRVKEERKEDTLVGVYWYHLVVDKEVIRFRQVLARLPFLATPAAPISSAD